MVHLKFKASATAEQINKAEKAFENLKNEIPEIIHLEWGLNDSEEGNSKKFTHTFTLTFNDAHGREIYLFHKAHIALVENIGPIIEDVFVMDYWTSNK
ncbi:Dabb family protein [Cellulophaga baltica 4]|nr:Dabb family protein [Cellulophaga baltica 4]